MLESFTATGFRNLFPEIVRLSGGTTFFFGENGAGKTNLLEAIALLCGRASFRGAKPGEMAQDSSFAVRGRLRSTDAVLDPMVIWEGGAQRYFCGARHVGRAEAAGWVASVFLCPEDRGLFLGPPVVRRRFLDRLTVSLFPSAAQDLLRFSRTLAERNRLLSAGAPEPRTLESWTDQFIAVAVGVWRRRRLALALWQEEMAQLLRESDRLSEVEISYVGGPPSPETAEEFYRHAARRLFAAEAVRGHTLFGPQRDDICFRRDARLFSCAASSGEILRMAFLVRLAEGRAISRERAAPPLFALDDFDADLSPRAAEQLLSLLPEGAQVLLTTARASAISCCPRRPDLIYEVEGGQARIHPSREYLKAVG